MSISRAGDASLPSLCVGIDGPTYATIVMYDDRFKVGSPSEIVQFHLTAFLVTVLDGSEELCRPAHSAEKRKAPLKERATNLRFQ